MENNSTGSMLILVGESGTTWSSAEGRGQMLGEGNERHIEREV